MAKKLLITVSTLDLKQIASNIGIPSSFTAKTAIPTISSILFLIEQSINEIYIAYSEESNNIISRGRELYNQVIDITSFQLKYSMLPSILYAPGVPLFSFLKENIHDPLINRVKKLLAPLEQYDRQYQTDLVETLEYLLFTEDHQYVSQMLNIHRNTLNYRRQRIKDILKVNPFESPYRLQYELAILLRE